MLHWVLERLHSAVRLVVQGALDGRVEAARSKIGLNASVDRLRIVLVEPRVQILQFARRKRSDRAFNVFDCVLAHGTASYFTRAVRKAPQWMRQSLIPKLLAAGLLVVPLVAVPVRIWAAEEARVKRRMAANEAECASFFKSTPLLPSLNSVQKRISFN
jgi:hypothetical protein